MIKVEKYKGTYLVYSNEGKPIYQKGKGVYSICNVEDEPNLDNFKEIDVE